MAATPRTIVSFSEGGDTTPICDRASLTGGTDEQGEYLWSGRGRRFSLPSSDVHVYTPASLKHSPDNVQRHLLKRFNLS